MNNHVPAIVNAAASSREAHLKLREFLQHVILRILFEQNVLRNWVFHDGTALRIIHQLNRFSEDLDFHLTKADPGYSFSPIISKLIKGLELQGYSVSDTVAREKTVRAAYVKFHNLLFENGLSFHRNEKLSIKLEVDTNPPDGFRCKTTLVNTFFPFSLIHHDSSSFLAGKIHALLQRPYTKGRDYYDLMFLLSRGKQISPNLEYLNRALSQSAWSGAPLRPDTWRNVLSQRIRETNWLSVKQDVEPFLESSADLSLMEKTLMLDLVIKE